jgi:hypothetical protein
MDRRNIRQDLLDARKAGIIVTPESGGKLSVSSSSKPPVALIEILRQNKEAALEFYGTLETKLQDGQQWLIKAEKKMWDGDSPAGSARMLRIFTRTMFAWDDMDSLVEPRRCPIGPEGCHPDSMVICRTCGGS